MALKKGLNMLQSLQDSGPLTICNFSNLSRFLGSGNGMSAWAQIRQFSMELNGH